MKKILFLTLFVFACLITASAQKKVSILGDSYSTFDGSITPSTNTCWYYGADSKKSKDNDVKKVEQTWWKIFANEHGYTIDTNNSFSGATISHRGYDNNNYADRSFITRMYNIGNPDVLLIFGGTNDSWANSPLGEYQNRKWTNKDLFYFRPAFSYLLYELKRLYPDMKIYNITNSELSEGITSSMDVICKQYKVKNILLHDIEKQSGHPSQKGMKAISDQIWKVISQDN